MKGGRTARLASEAMRQPCDRGEPLSLGAKLEISYKLHAKRRGPRMSLAVEKRHRNAPDYAGGAPIKRCRCTVFRSR
jgi:hypothetical protein